MALYQLGKDHYLHHQTKDGVQPRLHAKDEKIEFDGKPSMSMIPLDDTAKKRVEETNAERKANHEELRRRGNSTKLGWSPGFDTSFMKNLKPESEDRQIDARPSTKARRAAARV